MHPENLKALWICYKPRMVFAGSTTNQGHNTLLIVPHMSCTLILSLCGMLKRSCTLLKKNVVSVAFKGT